MLLPHGRGSASICPGGLLCAPSLQLPQLYTFALFCLGCQAFLQHQYRGAGCCSASACARVLVLQCRPCKSLYRTQGKPAHRRPLMAAATSSLPAAALLTRTAPAISTGCGARAHARAQRSFAPVTTLAHSAECGGTGSSMGAVTAVGCHSPLSMACIAANMPMPLLPQACPERPPRPRLSGPLSCYHGHLAAEASALIQVLLHKL
jgi:hypothetical protein